MVYAQFFTLGTGYVPGTIPPEFGEPTPVEACGDRGVIILDGRETRASWDQIARRESRKRGFIGYSLHRGETFTRSAEIQGFVRVEG